MTDEGYRTRLTYASVITTHIMCEHDPDNTLFPRLRETTCSKRVLDETDLAMATALATMALTSYPRVLTDDQVYICARYWVLDHGTRAEIVCDAKVVLYLCAKYATDASAAMARQMLEDVINRPDLDQAVLRDILTLAKQVNKDSMSDTEKKLCVEYEEKVQSILPESAAP